VRVKVKNDQNLNETLERVFKHIESSAMGFPSENDLKGLFDDVDVNSNKLGATVIKRTELLVKLLEAIGDLNLGNFQVMNKTTDTKFFTNDAGLMLLKRFKAFYSILFPATLKKNKLLRVNKFII